MKAGDVGYISASIKTVSDIKVGDTITETARQSEPLPGYRNIQPVVYSGIFPIEGDKYNALKDALEKIKLSDSSLIYTPETSVALGYGFRCGFLGLLHLEIITERLNREFNLDVITTMPSVTYKVYKRNGDMEEISNPISMPDADQIDYTEEPFIKA